MAHDLSLLLFFFLFDIMAVHALFPPEGNFDVILYATLDLVRVLYFRSHCCSFPHAFFAFSLLPPPVVNAKPKPPFSPGRRSPSCVAVSGLPPQAIISFSLILFMSVFFFWVTAVFPPHFFCFSF